MANESTWTERCAEAGYEVLLPLGRGGMAEVWLARPFAPEGLGRLVALKRIRPEWHHDPECREMFGWEAFIAASLRNPNAVQVQDVTSVAGEPVMVLEYLEGFDLSVFTDAVSPMDPWLVAFIVEQVAGALAAAHSLTMPDGRPLGLVHRDVSPHNVFATVDGQVKLLDFGVAYLAVRPENAAPNTVKGKVSYMAPEMFDGSRFDGRADLFSLGVVFHELVTQQRLFARRTRTAAAAAVCLAPIPDPCFVRPDCPRILGDIIGRCLERDPRDRFSSALELRQSLRRAMLEAGRVPQVLRDQLAEIVARREFSTPLARSGERSIDGRFREPTHSAGLDETTPVRPTSRAARSGSARSSGVSLRDEDATRLARRRTG